MAQDMTRTEKQRTRLIKLLEELFQLDQPDLDFGFYKIMHAKAETVSNFIQKDLLKIIQDAFGEVDEEKVEAARLKYEQAIEQAKSFGAPDPEATEPVQKAKAAYDAAKDSGANEGEIYEHLYRFFERYYDNGDFMSRRYFARETQGKAAPYSVPYDGREVYLHWANRVQYYIKTSEYLSNFTFDVAKHFTKAQRASYNMPESLKLHCRIAEASEGEHNNNKAGDKTERFFLIHSEQPVVMENGELVLQFEYRPDHEKSGTAAKWQEKRLDEAESAILHALTGLGDAAAYNEALRTEMGEEKNKRTLLRKYLNQYTKRNTTDYFIHKDLGGFLKRELDFYIKNEIMRLDDIEAADAPRVEAYLDKIKVLRKIAGHLITFLAQLEEFQKKLWLKKKFVTDTQYCITLDRIPEHFYPTIAGNDAQRAEWVSLFAIDELEGYGDYARHCEEGQCPDAAISFLKANPFLVLDTRHFDTSFKDALLADMQGLDEQLDGLLISSENFQALGLMQEKYQDAINTIYIDPPYNTGGDGFAYKDSYQHSSWMSMIFDRLSLSYSLLANKNVFFVSIDEDERGNLENVMNSIFDKKNRIEEVIWVQNTTKNQSPTYSTNHEYVEVFSKDKDVVKADSSCFRESKPGYNEITELLNSLNPDYPLIVEIEAALKNLYSEHKKELKQNEETLDEWKGIYNYKYAEYRDINGKYVPEEEAKKRAARIWVYREADTSMPQVKKDSQKAEFRDPNHPTFRFYQPEHPITHKPCPHPKTGWVWPRFPHGKQKNSFEELAADNRIAWGKDENKIPQRKCFLHEVETNVSKSVINDYTDGEKELTNLFGRSRTFGGPKPTSLIERFCDQSSLKNGIFCDFFAGSGTSGEAVLKYRRDKDFLSKFILVEA